MTCFTSRAARAVRNMNRKFAKVVAGAIPRGVRVGTTWAIPAAAVQQQ